MAKVSLELEPFPVPTGAAVKLPAGKRQDGMQATPVIELKHLSDESLQALIEEFAEGVMLAARGKQDRE